MARPRISILLPIQDDREAGVESVRSWLGGQTAAGELYELIALAPGRDHRLEGAVRPLLRSQDRWLEIDGAPVEDEPAIRWTTGLALIRVNVPGDGPMRGRLELRPLQRPAKARRARPRIAIDDRAVSATVSENAIEFEIEPGRHWLALACAPLRPRRHGVNDHRRVGLPVRALSFERL